MPGGLARPGALSGSRNAAAGSSGLHFGPPGGILPQPWPCLPGITVLHKQCQIFACSGIMSNVTVTVSAIPSEQLYTQTLG